MITLSLTPDVLGCCNPTGTPVKMVEVDDGQARSSTQFRREGRLARSARSDDGYSLHGL